MLHQDRNAAIFYRRDCRVQVIDRKQDPYSRSAIKCVYPVLLHPA